jgi:A/G-specific adenine glycosylase
MPIVNKLLKWYKKNDVQYPWRLTTNPYHIWVSEIMLQQTQAQTVIPYFNNWLIKFPNINSVAKAKSDDILKSWEGLGYYARARNFHLACKKLCEKGLNVVPKDFNEFIQLPGVGEYTASAVLSIAYNKPLPAIDSNVIRIVSRINEIPFTFPKSKKIINEYLVSILPKKNSGDFNQSMMDFGRFVCRNIAPKCNDCIINIHCNAFVNNNVDNFPIKLKKPKKPHYNIAVGVIWNENKILITKRPNNGLLGGLWEFPGGKIKTNESSQQCVIREIKEELNIKIRIQKKIHQIQHAYSHFSITMHAYNCQFIKGNLKLLGCTDFKWINPGDIEKFAFPKANHKIFNKIYDHIY